MNEYGYRSANSHEFIDETWVENPLHALSIIAGYARKDYDFKKNYEDVVKKREESYRDVLAKMPECEEKEQFKLFYGWALDAWGWMKTIIFISMRCCLLRQDCFC
ncbi:hypothetical protein AAAC51_26900 [Priestia megaterium]